MSVGGNIVDIVEVAADRWWINTLAPGSDTRVGRTVAVYCDPRPERPEVGDTLWWQGGCCFWTPADRSRTDVKLKKIGCSGVAHPDEPHCLVCGCTVKFCEKHGGHTDAERQAARSGGE